MSKPQGRLPRRYRVMWDQNHGYESMHNPPMAPETHAAGHLGYFEGTPVDACAEGIGPDAGYVCAFPSAEDTHGVPGRALRAGRHARRRALLAPRRESEADLGQPATIRSACRWRRRTAWASTSGFASA